MDILIHPALSGRRDFFGEPHPTQAGVRMMRRVGVAEESCRGRHGARDLAARVVAAFANPIVAPLLAAAAAPPRPFKVSIAQRG